MMTDTQAEGAAGKGRILQLLEHASNSLFGKDRVRMQKQQDISLGKPGSNVHLYGATAFLGKYQFQVNFLRMDMRVYGSNGIAPWIPVHHDDFGLVFRKRFCQVTQGLVDGNSFVVNWHNDGKLRGY